MRGPAFRPAHNNRACRQAQDGGERLKRDEISLNRHRALDSCLG
ncbi:hypothetical protein chiPu_0029852, partial [Chiloscyllium punctatum]|nr:hypothetical protein [Chiloscyllium punctatum]